MADFSNKKIRKLYEEEIVTASAEDIALLSALLQPLLKAALERIQKLSTSQIYQLDPMPAKASTDGNKANA